LHGDSFVGKHLHDRGRDVWVLATGDLWTAFDDGHPAAKAAIGLRQLQPDISAAEHDEVLGQPIEFQHLDISKRRRRVEPRNIGDRRVRPDIDHHIIPGEHTAAAIVEADRDRLRLHKPASAHNQLGTARVALEVHGDQPVDHLALMRQDFHHIYRNGTRYRAEPVGMADEIGDLGAPDLVLAGQAVRVGAGAADQLAFDNGGALSGARQMPGEVFAGLAATEDQDVNPFRFRHRQLPRGRWPCASFLLVGMRAVPLSLPASPCAGLASIPKASLLDASETIGGLYGARQFCNRPAYCCGKTGLCEVICRLWPLGQRRPRYQLSGCQSEG
jgi:hypothetical protein